MKIENEIFKKVDIDISKLTKYGFKKKSEIYVFEKPFKDGDFKAIIKINAKGEISGKVFDIENNEEYFPLRVKCSQNAFVNAVKADYIKILEDIKKNCSNPKHFIFPQSNRIANLILKKYKSKIDYPWAKYNNYGVFRNPDNNKWFALVMNIDKSKIDKTKTGEIEIVNVKLDENEIKNLIKQKGFYPAYHMNKKSWISVILDETLSDEAVMKYIDESRKFTEGKKS